MTNEERTEARQGYLEAVSHPGKFEAEPIYSPYFYEMVMEGGGEEYYFGEGEPVYSMFEVTPEDVDLFPELKDVYGVCCWETDSGFFNCLPLKTKEDYEAEIEHFEKQQEEIEEGE